MVHPSATTLRDTLLPMPPVPMAVEEGGRVDGVGFWRVFTAGIDHELETSEDGVEGNCVVGLSCYTRATVTLNFGYR